MGKTEGKRQHKRSSLRWKDNIKMDLRGVGRGIDWMRIRTGGGLL